MADRNAVDPSRFLPNTSYLKKYLEILRGEEAIIKKILEDRDNKVKTWSQRAEKKIFNHSMSMGRQLKDAYLRLGGDDKQVPAAFNEEERGVPEDINNGSARSNATDDAAGATNDLHPPVVRDGGQPKRKADSVAETNTPSKKIKDVATNHESDELPGTTYIPSLAGGTIMQSALNVLYRGLKITPQQIRQIDLSEAQTPRQALADVLGAVSFLAKDALTMLKEIQATPSDGYPSAHFTRALRTTYQDHELRSMGLGFGSFELPRLWKSTVAFRKDLTTLKHKLYHWLLDLSRYTITALFMMAALLQLPAFKGEPFIDCPSESYVQQDLWRAHVEMDFAMDEIHKGAGTIVDKDCWGRWFRAPRHSLAQGELGEAFCAFMADRERDCMEDFVLHGSRPAEICEKMLGRTSSTA
ncbi:hypothetical protein PG991_006254 [Apiospora marii]|uniref:Uncharacterized protein n=1 Tax=Apiospora marii TaxID=335849 RepID=A0ABR1SBJ1_9PEZI